MTSAASPQPPSSGSNQGSKVSGSVATASCFVLGSIIAALTGPPVDWTVLLGLVFGVGLGWALHSRWRTMAQVISCLSCLPLWVGAGSQLGEVGLILGAIAVGIVVLGWSDRPHRRVGILLLLLGAVEALRSWLLGGTAQIPIAMGLFLYGVLGAGVWGACRERGTSAIGGLVLVSLMGGRLIHVVLMGDEAALVERAGWGLSVEAQGISQPESGLDLVRDGYQTPALVRGLLQHYSVEELMKEGLEPRVDQLTVEEVIRAARWLEVQGRGGQGLDLLRAAQHEGRACWWGELFARTQGEPVENCTWARPEEVTEVGDSSGGVSGYLGEDGNGVLNVHLSDGGGRVEIHIPGDITRVDLGMDHGAVMPLQPSDGVGWWTTQSSYAAGPHRLHIQAYGSLEQGLSISLRLR
jgi:hypothetical protein